MGSDNIVLMVLANYEFRDEEYLDTLSALKDAGIETKIAALSNEDCKGIGGTLVSVDYTFDEIDMVQFSAIIFIGGLGVEDYLHDESVHSLAKTFHNNNKVVAAICWAPAILANAGVLSGKKATAWEGAKDVLMSSGAIYTGEQVTIDGKIVTANGPDAASKFGMAIAEMIGE